MIYTRKLHDLRITIHDQWDGKEKLTSENLGKVRQFITEMVLDELLAASPRFYA